MLTKVIHGSSAFSELASEWDTLAQNGMTDTPFQTRAYQQAWWTHLHPPQATLHTVTVWQSNEPVAIACFYLLDGTLYFNGCVEETDYLDLIASADKAQAAWTAVFDRLCSPDFPTWHALDLCNIPEASPSRPILRQIAEQYGFHWHEEINEVCPVITLPQTFDEYLDTLDKKQRHEIRRKLRRAHGAGVSIRQIGPEDNLEQAVNDFLTLLQLSTFEKRDWLNDGRRAVFHETARAALENGTLQLLFAEIEGERAAALFNFDYKNRIWVYNSGLNPTIYGNLSIGVVLTAKAIEMAIENGRSEFDFLRGNEEYKYRFGATDTRIYRVQITRAV